MYKAFKLTRLITEKLSQNFAQFSNMSFAHSIKPKSVVRNGARLVVAKTLQEAVIEEMKLLDNAIANAQFEAMIQSAVKKQNPQ